MPLIVRWPGHVKPGHVTDEIVHVTDLFTTLVAAGGGQVPTDRPIDGVNQLALWTGSSEKSAREGFLFYIKNELRAVKWRHWKMHLVYESEPNNGTRHLETPWLFNIKRDPKEETDAAMEDGWVRGPIRRMIQAFEQTLRDHKPIPPGIGDDYAPSKSTQH